MSDVEHLAPEPTPADFAGPADLDSLAPVPAPTESCPRRAFLIATGRRTWKGRHSITEERRRVFLETLSVTGSPRWRQRGS